MDKKLKIKKTKNRDCSARWLSIVEMSNWAIRWSIYHAATLLQTGLCCLAQLCIISKSWAWAQDSYSCNMWKLYTGAVSYSYTSVSCNYYYYCAHGSWCYVCTYVNQCYILIFNKYELAIYYIQMYECLLILITIARC